MPRKKSNPRSVQGRKAECAAESDSMTTSSLLADMQTHHRDLLAEQNRLQQEIAAVAEAMSALGGVAAPEGIKAAVARVRTTKPARVKAPARRPEPARRSGAQPNGPSLKDYVMRVLGSSKKPMRVKDIETGIVKAGYATTGKSLPNQVSMALADLAKARKVKKVSRGLYRK